MNSFQGWLARALKIQKNQLVKTDVKTSLWLRNIAILCPWWHQGRFLVAGLRHLFLEIKLNRQLKMWQEQFSR